jgi:hypothetical protein
MKIFLLRAWAVWRRFRRGSPAKRHLQYASQVEVLMRRANPFACWQERANWMTDVAEWLRHEPRAALRDDSAWRRARHQRTRYLLDWLDAHRDVRRLVQTAIQKKRSVRNCLPIPACHANRLSLANCGSA